MLTSKLHRVPALPGLDQLAPNLLAMASNLRGIKMLFVCCLDRIECSSVTQTAEILPILRRWIRMLQLGT